MDYSTAAGISALGLCGFYFYTRREGANTRVVNELYESFMGEARKRECIAHMEEVVKGGSDINYDDLKGKYTRVLNALTILTPLSRSERKRKIRWINEFPDNNYS